MDEVQPRTLPPPETGGLGILITTAIFIVILWSLSQLSDIQTVRNNWQQYRCRPDIMLFAKFYGYDAVDNMQFCLKQGFDERAKAAMGPMFVYLKKFVDILMTLLKSLNSIRMIFATIIGSVTRIFSEFSARLQSFFFRVQTSVIRIKFLISRIFGIVYSLLFMAMSGIKATTNFGNTFLFKFLDTFCFDPDTLVKIESKGMIPIRDVRIGDRFQDSEECVTATFQFMADGQPMVRLPGGIFVSTNHYLLHEKTKKWIQAKDHPEALPVGEWDGGAARPLICLNTTTHTFPIGRFVFRDYDETSAADVETMMNVSNQLNASSTTKIPYANYDTCCGGAVKIKLASGVSVPASQITLGTPLTHGTVVGLVVKECKEICVIDGHCFTPGTAIWNEEQKRWLRASEVAPVQSLPLSAKCYSFVVTPSACIETETGVMFRDYVEIHSPDTENVYTAALQAE